MKRGMQKQIAQNAGISAPYLNQILFGKKRPSWATAKKLAIATSTDPVLWLDGAIDEIRNALETGIENESVRSLL